MLWPATARGLRLSTWVARHFLRVPFSVCSKANQWDNHHFVGSPILRHTHISCFQRSPVPSRCGRRLLQTWNFGSSVAKTGDVHQKQKLKNSSTSLSSPLGSPILLPKIHEPAAIHTCCSVSPATSCCQRLLYSDVKLPRHHSRPRK